MSLYQVISFSLSTFLRFIHVTLETSSVNLQVLCFCAFAFCQSIPQWQMPRRPPPHIVTSSAAMGILTQTPWCSRVRSLHKGKDCITGSMYMPSTAYVIQSLSRTGWVRLPQFCRQGGEGLRNSHGIRGWPWHERKSLSSETSAHSTCHWTHSDKLLFEVTWFYFCGTVTIIPNW